MSPKKIRELRVRAGLSQGELADKIGVTQATISNWEIKKSAPSPAQQAAIRKVIGSGEPDAGVSDASPTAAWVAKARLSQGFSVPELAEKTGLTSQALYRIESGVTRNLRSTTRQRLEKVLGKMPKDAAQEAAEEAAVSGLGLLEDFDPHSDDERPPYPGIYVIYDISERPVYVGEGSNVKKRIRDHEEKFWFKRPIVESASWIRVDDGQLRRQVETILIKFLKSNAVINKQNVER